MATAVSKDCVRGGYCGSSPFMLFEKMECDLFTLVTKWDNDYKMTRTREVQWSTVSNMYRQILLAVRTLHRANLVHRDLKLENVLVKWNVRRKHYDIKICDLGMTEVAGTQAKHGYGTSEYLSPNMLKWYKKQYDTTPLVQFSDDIWQCGILLHELVYGKVPWKHPSFTPRSLPPLNYPNSCYRTTGLNVSANRALIRTMLTVMDTRPTIEVVLKQFETLGEWV